MRKLLPALMVLGASLVLVAPAGAALKLVSNQNAFPQVNGSTLIWEAEGQNTTDGTGAYVWTVPASGSSPASILFQGPARPQRGGRRHRSQQDDPGSAARRLRRDAQLRLLPAPGRRVQEPAGRQEQPEHVRRLLPERDEHLRGRPERAADPDHAERRPRRSVPRGHHHRDAAGRQRLDPRDDRQLQHRRELARPPAGAHHLGQRSRRPRRSSWPATATASARCASRASTSPASSRSRTRSRRRSWSSTSRPVTSSTRSRRARPGPSTRTSTSAPTAASWPRSAASPSCRSSASPRVRPQGKTLPVLDGDDRVRAADRGLAAGVPAHHVGRHAAHHDLALGRLGEGLRDPVRASATPRTGSTPATPGPP